MATCGNAFCKQLFESRRRNHLFCSDACRREEQGRLRADGTPRRQHSLRVPREPEDASWCILDARGPCPACRAEECWLWQEQGTLVVLCGRCTQKKALGVVRIDTRIAAEAVVQETRRDECRYGHTEGFFADRKGCRRCRKCHSLRNSLWRKKKRAELQAAKVAA